MVTLIASLVPACIAFLGALFMFARWVGKIDRNTVATEDLTAAFQSFSDKMMSKVDDHEIRLRVIEAGLPRKGA